MTVDISIHTDYLSDMNEAHCSIVTADFVEFCIHVFIHDSV